MSALGEHPRNMRSRAATSTCGAPRLVMVRILRLPSLVWSGAAVCPELQCTAPDNAILNSVDNAIDNVTNNASSAWTRSRSRGEGSEVSRSLVFPPEAKRFQGTETPGVPRGSRTGEDRGDGHTPRLHDSCLAAKHLVHRTKTIIYSNFPMWHEACSLHVFVQHQTPRLG